MTPAAELRAIVGDGLVWDAGPADAIDGVIPALVVRPGTVEAVSRVMTVASRRGWRVAPRGGGTKMGLGNPPTGVDLVLDLRRLNQVLEHAAGDLVVSVEGGVRMKTLQAELADLGQMLALDPSERGATVGGVIATNAYGPRRFRYGTVRDLLIGVTIVLADGTVATAGGKVVKNVAGYDLGKLMTGSLGTLGIVVGAIVRLHPRPSDLRLVEAELATAGDVGNAAQRLLHSSLVPSAIQLSWASTGAPRVGVLLEGGEASVSSQAGAAADRLAPASSAIRLGDEARMRWREMITPPLSALVIRITCPPADLAATIDAVRLAAGRTSDDWHLTGMLGSGILALRLGSIEPAQAVALVTELRSGLMTGNVTVVAAPPEVKRDLDVWGPVGDSIGLMRRVKHEFDPQHIINPGRFVGGI